MRVSRLLSTGLSVTFALCLIAVASGSGVRAAMPASPALVVSDGWEVDDTPASANVLEGGQLHTIHVGSDADWAYAWLNAGHTYAFYLTDVQSGLSPYFELYTFDGTLLAGDVSSIVYTPVATSGVRLKVTSIGGTTGSYTLRKRIDSRAVLALDAQAADAARRGDVLLYDPATGGWRQELSTGGGTFAEIVGGWSPGWSVQPARFNDDFFSDLFLFNSTTGQWFKLTGRAGGFDTLEMGTWFAGWSRWIADLNGDGISDVFLYDTSGGTWFQCLSPSNGTPGFTYHSGGWSPAWEVLPMNFDGDGAADFFLFNRTSGQWFRALATGAGGFTYPVSGFWSTGWQFYPGDFSGDGLTDLFLHNPSNGQWFVAKTAGNTFEFTFGTWSLGWQPYVFDLVGDGRDDIFLLNPATGQWFLMFSTDSGLVSLAGSFWTPGWQIRFTDLNGDGSHDVVLYNSSSGQWFTGTMDQSANFTYASGSWPAGATLVVK